MSTFAIDTYTGNGSTTSYSVTFPYITTADVIVTINGVTKTLTTHYTFSNSSTISFGSAPANGEVIKITRSSNRNARLVDYQDGSTLTEASLDQDGNQAFFMAQEAIDITTNNISLSNSTDQWDANSKRITNVADPTSAQDVATKNYLENTFLTTANKTALTTVNANIANINAVNSNATNINSAVSNATNINTVATNIGSVNTVATDIAKVITVANDLAEAVSEVETVADDLNETSSEIEVVGGAITNVNNVGNNIANVNTVAGISANVTTVAGNNSNVSTVAGISSDVTAVAGISSDVQAVENIKANVTTVAGISGNVTSVAGIASAVSAVNSNSSNINAVNSNATNINTVAGNNSNISTVAGVSGNISTVAGVASNVTTVAGISSAVSTVSGMSTAINTVNSNATNVNAVAGAIANVNNVGGSIANVNTVAGNLSGVNAFGERYRVSSNAPTTSLDSGDLWFDSTNNILKVYGASGFQSAGSSVNGLLDTFKYTVSSSTTTISGSDDNSNTLAYDANKVSVFLNGIRMVTGTDITATNGTSIVFASAIGATGTDVVEIEAFGTFSVANMNASNLTSGTVPDARITGAYTGITNLTMSGDLTVDTDTLFVDASANKVGIGTTAPARQLTVSGSTAPFIAIVETGTSGSATLSFGDSSADNVGKIQYSNLTNSLAFTVNSSERMNIANSGRVGINVTSASGLLHVQSASSGASVNSSGDEIIAENSANAGISILSGNSNQGQLIFGDDGDNNVGRLQYDHSNNSMQFIVNANERARIDASGNLLLGATSVQGGTANTLQIADGSSARLLLQNTGGGRTYGFFAGTDGKLGLYDYSASAQRLAVDTSGNFGIGTAAPNSLGSNITTLEITGGSTIRTGGVRINNSNNTIAASFYGSNTGATFGTESNADLKFVTNNNERVRIHSGGVMSAVNGIALGVGTANTASNVLDDYEEGTFTPSFTSGVSGSGYDHQVGRYTKIGNKVFIEIQLDGNGLSGNGGHLKIGGLPFTSNSSAPYGGVTFGYNAGFKTDGNMTFNKGSNSTTLDGYNWDGSTLLGNETNNINASILISGSYTTA